MNYEFPLNSQEHGNTGTQGVNRRRFLKRTGAATIGTVLLSSLPVSRARATAAASGSGITVTRLTASTTAGFQRNYDNVLGDEIASTPLIRYIEFEVSPPEAAWGAVVTKNGSHISIHSVNNCSGKVTVGVKGVSESQAPGDCEVICTVQTASDTTSVTCVVPKTVEAVPKTKLYPANEIRTYTMGLNSTTAPALLGNLEEGEKRKCYCKQVIVVMEVKDQFQTRLSDIYDGTAVKEQLVPGGPVMWVAINVNVSGGLYNDSTGVISETNVTSVVPGTWAAWEAQVPPAGLAIPNGSGTLRAVVAGHLCDPEFTRTFTNQGTGVQVSHTP